MKLTELNISDALKNNIAMLIENNRMPHAILIDSGNEKQRNELSSFLAAAFVCSSDNKPCGNCNNCMKAYAGIHPDIIISDPDDNNEKTFKIGVVRDIRQDAYILPNEADKKVYILRKADKMNTQSQNALLKIIEEPPSYARFILECDSRTSMLETVRSRVTSFGLGADDFLNTTEKSDKADLIASELAQSLMSITEIEFMKITSSFEKDKDILPYVVTSLRLIFRDAVIIKSGSNLVVGHYSDISRALAAKFSLKVLINLTEQCEHFIICINQNANKTLLLTRLCSVLRNTAYY